MLELFTAVLIAYMIFGANLEYLNYSTGKKFRLMTIFDWPWLIYTKGVTTA